MRNKFKLLFFLLPLLLWGVTQAQGDSVLRLTKADSVDYPQVRLTILAADDALSPITDLSDLLLQENGVPITDFGINRVPIGVEAIFIVDANSRLLQTDAGNELSRREVVRNSIVRYATEFMGASGQDRVTIIVPAGNEGAEFLLQGGNQPAAVTAAINSYEPETLPRLTPLLAMMEAALAKARQNYEAGRFQAIILVTDGRDLDEQLFSPDVAAAANALDMPIYALITGSRADPDEIVNVRRFTDRTRAFFAHMPQPIDGDPVFSAMKAHATQAQISYRSTVAENGEVAVTIALAGEVVTGTVQVAVQSPVVNRVDGVRAIRRVGDKATTTLGDLEPKQAEIAAQITWPDGHPRRLQLIELLVDGEVITPLNLPALDESNQVKLRWAIGGLNAGSYEVAVRVTDELGFTAKSSNAPVTINIFRPTAAPQATVVPTATPMPAFDIRQIKITPAKQQILGVLAAIFVVTSILLWLARRFRLRKEAKLAARIHELLRPKKDEPQSTIAGTMALSLQQINGSGKYPITKTATMLGRDKKLVDIVLDDALVSRLHARIQWRDGLYWLFDEGSSAGTYLNFERLGLQPRPLSPGDEIHIGGIRLLLTVWEREEE